MRRYWSGACTVRALADSEPGPGPVYRAMENYGMAGLAPAAAGFMRPARNERNIVTAA